MSGSGEAKLLSGLPHSASPTTASISRVAIPRFSTRSGGAVDGGGMINSSNSTNGTRTRSQRKPNNKGKEPIRGDGALSPFERDTSYHNDATSYSSCTGSQPLAVEGLANGRSKFRGSLIAASDVFSFKFGRRKPSVRQPPRPIILPGVIEISASRQDEEVEERNRLREMAAQAIGLGPFMVSQGSESRDESTTDEEVEDQLRSSDNSEMRHLSYPRSSESTPNIAVRSPHDSNFSETIPAQPSAGRLRSGSVLVHSPTTKKALTPVPSFPSTVSALASFRQSGGVYPKYYPPSSLRIFALSKSWKSRFLVLSSPETLVTRGQGPAVSYLHLFKSSGPEERELERLEINEESVVFVAEEEVGGRRQVIKVGGADVGAMKKEYNYEEGGYTLWLLQITDQAEAQQWISNIKNAILGQRTVRAGLIPAHTLGKNEPRGDMDVMLSIRAQALVTSPIPKPRSTHSTSTQNAPQDRHYASSISSHSATSQRTSSKIAGANGPVSALKGLFTTSARPRSGSRATSIDFERKQERDVNDESFTGIRSLLGILRPNTPDTLSVSTPVARTSNLPFSGPVDPIDCRIDRKILTERQPVQSATADQPLVNKDRANRALSLGGLSLQPPPRTRRTTTRPVSEFSSLGFPGVGEQPNAIAVQVNDSSTSVSGSGLSTGRAETEPPYTHQLSAFHIGTPEHKSRAPSLRSVSTVNSDLALHIERSSSSTKRSSGPRRWSKQGILPNRLTPPIEPPPAIPGNHSTLGLHPYAAERTPSPTPSHSSQTSVISTLPSFSKRASGSSARSVNSYDAARSYSTATGASSSMNCAISVRSTSSHRSSMPPPRPPPTAALPPAPVQAPQDTPTPSEAAQSPPKPSFRNSVTQRAFRLSTTAPKPPPSTQLPPRPDEPGLKTHRRSSSGGCGTRGHSTKLETISGSPISSPKSVSPFPPPAGPLPPTPPITLLPSPQLPPVKQPSSSIKQRLRMLSAPLPSVGQSQNVPNQPQELTIASPIFTTPFPASPIAEKITLFQNDPSFLQMHTPTLPSKSLNLSLLPPPSEETAVITSLSPPPRRGSKQLLESELESPKRVAVPDEALLTVGGEPKHLSLSRPGSMMSINISTRWQAHETDSENSPLDVTPTDEPLEELPEEASEEKSTLEPRHLSLSRPGSVISLGIMAL